MTSEAIIKHRQKLATDEDQKEVNYWLRLVVANYLDGEGGSKPPKQQNGKFADVTNKYWEEGRYNAVTTNTLITAEVQTFLKPDFLWSKIPSVSARGDIVSMVRKAYYSWLWDMSNMGRAYWLKLMDMLTLGEGNIGAFVRGDGVEVEWCDGLSVMWDPAFKDPDKRRYVLYDKPLPLGIALKYYPDLAKKKPLNNDGKNAEEEIVVTCYWDRDERTEAVLYKNDFIHGPTASRYDANLPIRATVLAELPSMKNFLGIVARGLGSHELDLALMRSFRDVALASEPVGVGTGFSEEALNKLQTERPEEGFHILRGNNPNATFAWTRGPEIQQSSLAVKQMVEQNMNAEFGVNEFKQGRTDTNVDFASQLGYLAQQSGSRDKFLAQRIEEGMRGDILHLIMPIASAFEARTLSLSLNGIPIQFGPMEPINLFLGSDGEITFKPGGMVFKSSAQKLQEEMIFANILALAATMPPGLDEPWLLRVFEAAEVDSPGEWLERYRTAKAEMMMQQQAMAEAQMAAQAQGQAANPQGSPQKQPAAVS